MMRRSRAVSTPKHVAAAQGHARGFLEHILNSLPTPLFVKDHLHRFILVNDALCAMIGHTRADILGKSDYDFFPRDEADMFVRKDEMVFATRQENVNEEQISGAQGVRRTIITRKSVFRDFDGNDVLVGVISDITDRKRIEELLRLNAQVFAHSAEGMFITDEHNAILTVNHAFTEITGYAAEEVVGTNPRILSSGEQPREFYENMWRTLSEKGFWHGELSNRRKTGELYSEWLTISAIRDDAGRIRQHIGLFSDITKRKQAEERIRFLAHHDALTGLPNRSLLGDRVEQALLRSRRTNTTTAVMMLDLDRFKEVNDSLGHPAGDQLLKEVAQRLSDCVRESDTVSRVGGDEFVVVLAETVGPEDGVIAARKILAALGQPFLLQGHEARIGVSIGISVFPKDGADADSLLRTADEAMYRVKRTGRNNYAFAARRERRAERRSSPRSDVLAQPLTSVTPPAPRIPNPG
jgi:diguanylate cyclase (GGDEF)-like protein/PAS domain S-box-containing protein